MNTKVEYTESLPLRKESSLVEGIFFNANDQTAVFDLQDRIYRYKNVSRNDALTVANSVSAGSEYQRFKSKFGPSESLGDYDDIEWEKVPTQVSTGNGIYINGQRFSNGANGNIEFYQPRLSLSKDVKPLQSFKVGFVVVSDNGTTGSEKKHHNLFANSFAEAVSTVEELGKMLGLEFKVKEVSVVD